MKKLFIVAFIILALAAVWFYTTQSDMETVESAEDQEVTQVTESEETEEALPTGETKTFAVSGTNFAYDISEIRVSEGDTVTIEFESADGFHDWVVDEFDAATEKVQTGKTTSVTFVADKVGSYEYYCSVGSHRANGMVGTLIVE